MNNPNKKRLRRTMMFLNAQKPGLIKDPYIYKADSLMLDLEDEMCIRDSIIADTKFEFGLDEEGNVILGDEMLTPDSSRFWPLEGYEAGHGQPSFDKQFVRNWLLANPDSDYDLPQDVIDKTIAKYEEAYEMLTGKKL